ncbi:MAG: hypothetical protein ACLFV2_02150 [Desulfurivibrionaceae bacterium]
MATKNVIIMTTGSSGSSVLAGTIALKGYWLGEKTKKLKFDTYENAELVDLNKEILLLSGFNHHDCNDIPPPSVTDIKRLLDKIDISKYQAFIAKCDTHGPWLWKDPRLSYTIHFWGKILNLNKVNFIFIERDAKQSYTGLILKRKVPMSFMQHGLMNNNYNQSCLQFYRNNALPYLHINFQDLITFPDHYLKRIGKFLDIDLNLSDLQKIYNGDLYKKRFSTLNYYQARLFYLGYRYWRRDFVRFPRRNLFCCSR